MLTYSRTINSSDSGIAEWKGQHRYHSRSDFQRSGFLNCSATAFFSFLSFFFLNNKFITFKSRIITVLATISSHLLLISLVESVPSKRTGPAREIFKSYVHSISVTKQL